MSTTVSVGGFEVTTNNPDTASVVESLQPREEASPEPRVLVDKGQPVEEKPEKEGLSKAASEMGKEGGKAAAKAKAKAAKEKPKDGAVEARVRPGADLEVEGAGEGEEGADEAPEGKEAKAGDPRKDPKARIAELAREKNELRQRAERAEREAQRLARERAQPAPAPRPAAAPAPQATADDPEPDEGDFELHKDYVKALARWEYRQADKEAQAEFQKRFAASERDRTWHEARGRFAEAFKAAAQADPEFVANLSPEVGALMPSREAIDRGAHPSQLSPDNWIADELMAEPETAAQKMRHLSQNPDVLQRLRTLSSPRAVTRELAKIVPGHDVDSDAAIGGASADTQEPEISKATPPVRPLTGAPSVAQGNGAPRPGESFDEWIVRTNKVQPKR